MLRGKDGVDAYGQYWLRVKELDVTLNLVIIANVREVTIFWTLHDNIIHGFGVGWILCWPCLV